jgi:hypothetical protein
MNGEDTKSTGQTDGGDRRWRVLLLVPFVGLIWVPFYNVVEPAFFGLPFFYWYQFLWVFLTPALTYVVYRKTD